MTRRRIVIAVAGLLAIAAAVAAYGAIRAGDGDDVVPSVVGLRTAVAADRVREAGYTVELVERPIRADVERWTVYAQVPDAGEPLARGETVLLYFLVRDDVLPPPSGRPMPLTDGRASIQRLASSRFPPDQGWTRKLTCKQPRPDIVTCRVVGSQNGGPPCSGTAVAHYARPGTRQIRVDWRGAGTVCLLG